jgi:hypothetical protein
MPTIKQSQQRIDPSRLTPVQTQPASGAQLPTNLLPAEQYTQQSAFMISSLPPSASTLDAFTRQFYGGTRVPTFRTLPTR